MMIKIARIRRISMVELRFEDNGFFEDKFMI